MPEESVAEGLLARLEKGEDVGDVLRADIERRDGVFFDEWARTADGWQGIATPARGGGTAAETPPPYDPRDDPNLNILIYVISDYGHDQDDDEVGGQAYVNLIKETFPNADINEKRVGKLYDDEHSDTSFTVFCKDMGWVNMEASMLGKEYDQIHFMGHGGPVEGVTFEGEPFDLDEGMYKVPSLPLKPDGVIILDGCFTSSGPFHDWAVKMAGGDGDRVCDFEGISRMRWDYVEKDGKTTGKTDWYTEGNEDLMKVHNFIGLKKE